MKLKKVIISGAPGTGKSSIIKELKNRGYFCFEEVWKKEPQRLPLKFSLVFGIET